MRLIFADPAHGYILNIFAEKGYEAEWKHGRADLIIKSTTAAAIVGDTIILLSSKSGKKSKDSLRWLSD